MLDISQDLPIITRMAGKPDMAQTVERGMRAFMSLGTHGGVANYVLEGPRNKPLVYSQFAGVYPRGRQSEDSLLVLGVDPLRYEPPALYRKIVGLEVPESLRVLEIPDDPDLAANLDFRSRLLGMPTILLSIGEAPATREESVVLYAVQGMPPETALTRLRSNASRRLAEAN